MKLEGIERMDKADKVVLELGVGGVTVGEGAETPKSKKIVHGKIS